MSTARLIPVVLVLLLAVQEGHAGLLVRNDAIFGRIGQMIIEKCNWLVAAHLGLRRHSIQGLALTLATKVVLVEELRDGILVLRHVTPVAVLDGQSAAVFEVACG